MKNLQPQCEHPVIILNPHIKDILLSVGFYYLDGRKISVNKHKWYDEFPWSHFAKLKYKREIIDDELISTYDYSICARCYTIQDGEEIPLYMQVPCGKCVLCTEKKANEWVTRAMAETQTSSNKPYFVTLTYNNRYLPKDGVMKKDAQNFMKRLRINCERYTGQSHNIRFFLCSEYGSQFGRPHYHLLLWNMPNLQDNHIDDLIKKSWSVAVNKKVYASIPDTLDKYGRLQYKYQRKVNGITRHYALMGYYTLGDTDEGRFEARVRYAMKYMRKEQTIPDGKNSAFVFCSRRRGIGYEWIDKKKDEFRKYPQLLDVVLTDKFTGEKYQGCMPTYFKNIIAPSTSALISKDIRDSFHKYNYYYNVACTLIGHHYTPNKRVLSHYPTLKFHSAKVKSNIRVSNYKECDNYTRDLFKICDYLEWKLLNYKYDVDLAVQVPEYKKKHLYFTEIFVNSRSMESIPDKADRIKRNRLRARHREKL